MANKTELINEMKKQTIGVEVEMCDITRRNASEVAARYFGTGSYRYTGNEDGYCTWSAFDAQGRKWKFSRDCSILARTDDEKCELITPILTYNDIPLLQSLIRELRHFGAKSDPSHRCGVHIHIGANGHTAQSLRNLTNIMASHERLLISALAVDYDRVNSYCHTVDHNFLNQVNAKKPRTMSELADIWYRSHGCSYNRSAHYNDSRYHMLNLHATFTKGTVEFRLFQFDNPSANRKGGLHAGQLKAYIQLCLALSQTAKMAKSASPVEVQHENEKYAMRCWLLRLGFIGDEFETARNVFTNRLSGDSAFRHGRNAA